MDSEGRGVAKTAAKNTPCANGESRELDCPLQTSKLVSTYVQCLPDANEMVKLHTRRVSNYPISPVCIRKQGPRGKDTDHFLTREGGERGVVKMSL